MEIMKRGRPPKEPSDSLTERLDLRLSTIEREDYERAANKAGLKLSVWIRDRLGKAATKELR